MIIFGKDGSLKLPMDTKPSRSNPPDTISAEYSERERLAESFLLYGWYSRKQNLHDMA